MAKHTVREVVEETNVVEIEDEITTCDGCGEPVEEYLTLVEPDYDTLGGPSGPVLVDGVPHAPIEDVMSCLDSSPHYHFGSDCTRSCRCGLEENRNVGGVQFGPETDPEETETSSVELTRLDYHTIAFAAGSLLGVFVAIDSGALSGVLGVMWGYILVIAYFRWRGCL